MKASELFKNEVLNEHALELKGLGFNQPCSSSFEYAPGEFCDIPTYEQSFIWFKDQYNLEQVVGQVGDRDKYFAIVQSEHKGDFQSWDEALAKCMIELINIVKTQ